MDRGPFSTDILDLFARLKKQAKAVGGTIITLLGNHELMALEAEAKYVNSQEMEAFGGAEERFRAFSEGWRYRYLRKHPAVVLQRSTVFVHAGLAPWFARMGAAGVNALVREAIANGAWGHRALNAFADGPLWNRILITEASAGMCEGVGAALQELTKQSTAPVQRMVVGHTIQRDHRIHQFCNGSLVAIDISITAWNMLGADNLGAIEVVAHSSAPESHVVEHYPLRSPVDVAVSHMIVQRGPDGVLHLVVNPALQLYEGQRAPVRYTTLLIPVVAAVASRIHKHRTPRSVRNMLLLLMFAAAFFIALLNIVS